jgi:Ca-activated chloride channel family protein
VSFVAPELAWLALAGPLAGLVARSLLARRARAESSWVGRALEPRLRAGGPLRPRFVVPLLLGVALAGLALALARPRWGVSEQTVERKGIDVVFVVDTSLSMAAADVAPSRFWLAQSLVRRLAEALPGHRLALVAAEGDGLVLSPLTLDAAVVDLLLDSLAPGTLPLPGTRLAPGLERALALFPEGSEKFRALVVLSDGEDHGSELSAAAARAKEAGAIVHTVAIGAESGAPIPLPGGEGEFKRDRRGEVVVTRVRPETLAELSAATGGVHLVARDPTFEPGAIAEAIRELGGRPIEATVVSQLEERFQWPLAAAALALAALAALSPWRLRPRAEAA